jgi:hypothetical protein
MEKNSKQMKQPGAFQRAHSPATADVLLACKIKHEQKPLFKTQVKSVIRQTINPYQTELTVAKSEA